MTDILTKLAALTGEKSNLWVENWYGSPTQKGSSIWSIDQHGRRGKMLLHVGTTEEHHNVATAVVAMHNQFVSREADREQALIALVQEAAGEIERLKTALRDLLAVAKDGYCGDIYETRLEVEYPIHFNEAKQVLNPQEPT